MPGDCCISSAISASRTTLKDAIVTKTADGGLAIAVWNLVDPDQQGSTRM